MTILFISDLHLSPNHPEITKLFINFLETQASKAEKLYILGDFFEAWIGDDDPNPFLQEIKSHLKALTQKGIPVIIMHGNRDFLLGLRFTKETGCQLVTEDQLVINLFGTPTLLMHGDTLCLADVHYQAYRRKARNPTIQKIFLALPFRLRQWISQKMRQKSTQDISKKCEMIMDVTHSEVIACLKKNKVRHLIHGHTHRPGVHHFEYDSQSASRTVLGAWEDCGSVLMCEAGKQTLVKIAPVALSDVR